MIFEIETILKISHNYYFKCFTRLIRISTFWHFKINTGAKYTFFFALKIFFVHSLYKVKFCCQALQKFLHFSIRYKHITNFVSKRDKKWNSTMNSLYENFVIKMIRYKEVWLYLQSQANLLLIRLLQSTEATYLPSFENLQCKIADLCSV